MTQGFWKNHPDQWPVTTLTVGTVTYDQQQVLDILNQPVNGNGLVALAHQLIATLLNIANGSDPSCIQTTINDANNLIGNLVVPPIGNGFLDPCLTDPDVQELTNYNEGNLCSPHCKDLDPQPYLQDKDACPSQPMTPEQMDKKFKSQSRNKIIGCLNLIFKIYAPFIHSWNT